METAIAKLNNYRQSPRKVRVVADLIRGKKVEDAISSLKFLDKRAAEPIMKLIESAVANAKNLNIESDLLIKEITVNGGRTLFRRRPAARGSAHPIHKRTSHISVVLEGKKAEAEAKTEVKPKRTRAKKTANK
jgi:large subunit ribosomal protein L22